MALITGKMADPFFYGLRHTAIWLGNGPNFFFDGLTYSYNMENG